MEGYERGPAGNTALAAAFAVAQEMDEDQILVVNETEYTGAGKHPMPQLTFAKQNGVEVVFGDPDDDVPGKSIVFPKDPSLCKAREVDITRFKKSYVKNCGKFKNLEAASAEDIKFIMEEIREDRDFVVNELKNVGIKVL